MLSLLVNLILILVIVVFPASFFRSRAGARPAARRPVQEFCPDGSGHIKTTIPVTTNVPAKFDLPCKTNTTVILTEEPINGAQVESADRRSDHSDAPANIVLPAGTQLPIALDLTVPVEQKIPVNLR